jgi:hypothetical protein
MVLGLKWLRDINPDVDWASLSLVFRKERLAGAISMLLPEKKGKTTIEEIPDEDSISSYHLHDVFSTPAVGHLDQLPEMK